jgi:hypothetical protein
MSAARATGMNQNEPSSQPNARHFLIGISTSLGDESKSIPARSIVDRTIAHP